MPTSISSIATSALTVRFKQPFLSEALNAKLLTNQAGIYRGLRLDTSGSSLSVTLQSDPEVGDNLAVYQTPAGHTVGIRTVGNATLDLSAFASKTVVLAIFAQYSTTSSTAAEIRGYELDPTDEFTVATEFDELLVLGTVEVPASGTIAGTSISNRFRTYAGDNSFPQGSPRVPVIADPYFSLGPVATYQGVIAGATAGPVYPLDGWTLFNTGASTDSVIAIVASASKPGGRAVEVRSDSSPSTNTVGLRMRADVGIECGKLDGVDDWVDVEVEYEVVTVPTGTASLKIYFDAPESGAQTQTISLPVTSTGVKTAAQSFRLSSLPFSSDDLVYLVHVQLEVDFTSTVASTTYLSLRYAQVTVPNTTTLGGSYTASPMALRRIQHVGARVVRFHDVVTNEWTTGPWSGASAIFASQDTTFSLPALRVASADLSVSTTGLLVNGRVAAGVTGTTANTFSTPRFSATTHNNGSGPYVLAFEARSSTTRWQIWNDANTTYLTANAECTGSTNWGKINNGVAAYGLKFSTTSGMQFVSQIAGTNTWADGAWIVSGDGLTLGALTATWADASGVSATALWSMLNEIISDLGGTSGASRVGSAALTTLWADSSGVTSTNVHAQLEEIVDDLKVTAGAGRIGASVSSLWADASGISGATVVAALNEIVSELAATAGAGRVGYSPARLLTSATVKAGLDDLDYRVVKSSVAHHLEPLSPPSYASIARPMAATYGGGQFVVVGGVEAVVIATSPNGQVWTEETPISTDFLAGVAYNGTNLYVAVGTNIQSSPTAVTWTQRLASPADDLLGVTFGGGTWVTVGGSATVYSSPDGITWTVRAFAGGTFDARAVAHGAGVFIAVGDVSGTAYAERSADGITWVACTLPTPPTDRLNAIVFAGGQFVTVGDSLVCYTSPDGITWTLRTMSSLAGSLTMYGLAYTANCYIASGFGTVQISKDGITWEYVRDSYRGSLLAAAASPNAVVFVSEEDVADSATWLRVADLQQVANPVVAMTAESVAFVPGGGISSTNVQDAIQEVEGELGNYLLLSDSASFTRTMSIFNEIPATGWTVDATAGIRWSAPLTGVTKYFVIGPEVPDGVTITNVAVRVITGAVRGTVTDRFEVQVTQHNFSTAAMTTAGASGTTDNGLNATQTINHPANALIDRDTVDYYVAVRAPDNVAGSGQYVLGIQLTFTHANTRVQF